MLLQVAFESECFTTHTTFPLILFFFMCHRVFFIFVFTFRFMATDCTGIFPQFVFVINMFHLFLHVIEHFIACTFCTEDVPVHIQNCMRCIKFKQKKSREEMVCIEAKYPLQLVHLDFLQIGSKKKDKGKPICFSSYRSFYEVHKSLCHH